MSAERYPGNWRYQMVIKQRSHNHASFQPFFSDDYLVFIRDTELFSVMSAFFKTGVFDILYQVPSSSSSSAKDSMEAKKVVKKKGFSIDEILDKKPDIEKEVN